MALSLTQDLKVLIQKFERLSQENIALKKELKTLRSAQSSPLNESAKKEKKTKTEEKTPSLF